MDTATVLPEDERVKLELWRAFVGSRPDSRVDNNFATKCRELTRNSKPNCGFAEKAVQEFESLQENGSGELTSEKRSLLTATVDKINRNLMSLDAVDTSCPVLYGIKVQEMYLMLYSICKRIPNTVSDGWCDVRHFTGPWLQKVEFLAEISPQGSYAAFHIIRDVILSFSEIKNCSNVPPGNVMFTTLHWMASRFLRTTIHVVLKLYNEDPRYLENQPLLLIRRCLAMGIRAPLSNVLSKCQDLLEDIRSISRAEVTSLIISHKIPFDIAAIIKPYLLTHPRLRDKTVLHIYGTLPQDHIPQYCCITRDELHYFKRKTIVEPSKFTCRQLTCLDHSHYGEWNTNVRGYEHEHLFSPSGSSLLLSPRTCKYAWDDCTGHFDNNAWVLWPGRTLEDNTIEIEG